MKNKQTAVEWLESELDWLSNYMMDEHKEQLFNQAKAMEKEQIKDAFIKGENTFTMNSERYYNKTYANDTTKGLPEENSKRRGWHY